jgi:hypothetical protein
MQKLYHTYKYPRGCISEYTVIISWQLVICLSNFYTFFCDYKRIDIQFLSVKIVVAYADFTERHTIALIYRRYIMGDKSQELTIFWYVSCSK